VGGGGGGYGGVVDVPPMLPQRGTKEKEFVKQRLSVEKKRGRRGGRRGTGILKASTKGAWCPQRRTT